MAFLFPIPSSNSLFISTGQASAHKLHAVHFSSMIYLGFFVITALKFPASPFSSFNSEFVYNMIFGCLPAATNFGERIHIEQSFVGKVLSNWAIFPPKEGLFSII